MPKCISNVYVINICRSLLNLFSLSIIVSRHLKGQPINGNLTGSLERCGTSVMCR